jgi:hypothetical protein
VSSILKALKKVERESPRLEVSPTLPQKINTKRALNQRARGTWLFKRALTVVVVLLLVGVGTWFVLGNPELWVDKERPAPPAASRPAGETQVPPPQPDLKGAAGEPGPGIAREARPKAHVSPAEKAVKAEPLRRDPPPLAASPAKSPKPPAVESTRQAPEATSAAPGDESRYKLEAIVWSNNAESRFAVINGQIVRAGGAVGGLSVREIGRDHVDVRSAGRDWSMKFTVE